MNLLQECDITCPYCGEALSILLDGSVVEQHYIEDCQVCCRPINIGVDWRPDGQARVTARHEDDC
jgi:hypothetical protein